MVLLLTAVLFLLPIQAAYSRGWMEYTNDDTSTYYYVSSSGFSSIGGYKTGGSYHLWDTGGQPSSIGPWNAPLVWGGGWIYTISLPIYWDKDHDHDGMPQAYEQQFANWTDSSFNLHTMWDYNAFDASEDWDGDGFTNIQEYLCRSDPTDGESFFQFTDIRLVTPEGRPALAWWSATTAIKGMERYSPDYPSKLGFDILYADWTVAQQATGMTDQDWFNQKGTWQLVAGATNLKRDGEFNTYTDDIAGGEMGEGDIRFYRLAIGGTWDQGTPVWGASDYYSDVDDARLCSTVAGEILMIQKKTLAKGVQKSKFGLVGTTTGGGGELNLILGTDFFPAASLPAEATQFNLWVADASGTTVDFLSNAGNWKNEGQGASTRKVTGDNGFWLSFNTQTGFPSDKTFYIASQLKMDSYYHEIYQRTWNGQTIGPGDEGWDSPALNKVTFLQYNFPVEARFIADLSTEFPTLAGTTSAQFPGWEAFESDWVLFYDRNLSAKGGAFSGYTNENVVIYFDHGSDNQWEYFLPMGVMGTAVGTELTFSPGSPTVVMQYSNPNDLIVGASWSMKDNVPYQSGGSNSLKTYFEIGY